MNNLTIRRANMHDIPRIHILLQQVCNVHAVARPDLFVSNATKYTDSELQNIIIDDNRPIFVACVDNFVVGYAFTVRQTHDVEYLTNIATLYIDDLCVDDNYRRCGIGKALYTHVIDYARQNRYYNVTLNVWHGNESAMAFYRSIGMQVQKVGMEKIL